LTQHAPLVGTTTSGLSLDSIEFHPANAGERASAD
jgi:hypothetical protein